MLTLMKSNFIFFFILQVMLLIIPKKSWSDSRLQRSCFILVVFYFTFRSTIYFDLVFAEIVMYGLRFCLFGFVFSYICPIIQYHLVKTIIYSILNCLHIFYWTLTDRVCWVLFHLFFPLLLLFSSPFIYIFTDTTLLW